jgi:hypothetical protein
MALRELIPHLGLNINGDVAGLTCYTRRDGRLVMYPASPPTKPASEAQLAHRHRFRVAVASWKELSNYDKDLYARACDQLSLCCWGLNLWITLCMQQNDTLWQTLCAQSSLDLPRPPRL